MSKEKIEKIIQDIEERRGMYLFCAKTCTYLKINDTNFWLEIKKLLEEIANE